MNFRISIQDESYRLSIPGDPPDFSKNNIVLDCTKNSFAAFQIIFNPVENCSVNLGTASSFSIYPEEPWYRFSASVDVLGPLDINFITPLEDDNGILRYDIIEKSDYMRFPTEELCNLWCEIHIPKNINPGTYNGSVKVFTRKMFSDEQIIHEYYFTLQIRDIRLPDPTEYKMHLDLWQHLSNISRKHDVRLFSSDHFKVIEKYIESLARLGQKSITVIATEIPWSGQRTFNDLDEPTDLFEYSYIKTTKNSDDDFIYDYSNMDRYIELCMSYGIKDRIEVFGLCGIWMTEENGFGKAAKDFPDGVRVRYLDSGSGCYKYMTEEKQIRDFIRNLYLHFINKNWLELVRITADEPGDLEVYRKTISIILDEAPGFKLSIAINKAKFTTEFDSIMSDAVPSLSCLSEDYDFINENMISKPDKTVSWYVCCRPHFPNMFLKSPLLESRLICILTYYLNLDGFLRWNYTVWPEKPRERMIFRSPDWLAGDMNFVYPGNDGTPLLSLRYKALLRGIEDFELLHMANTLSDKSKAFIKTNLLKNVTLSTISEMGYDESKPLAPYSLDESNYKALRTLLYNYLT